MLRASAILLTGALVACAADVPDAELLAETETESVGTSSQAIINGTASPASQNSVVQLAFDANTGTGLLPLCSASLVAKNLILTARHCVGQVSNDQLTVQNFQNPSWIKVYVGQDAPQKIKAKQAPSAIGKKIFTSGGSSMFPDVALVLLDRAIENPLAKIRIDGGATKDEVVDVVGYGLTQNGTDATVRMMRAAKKVLQVYPATVEGEPLNPGEFTFSEAACSGDSGGPALSATTGAVVGVASRVGNGLEPTAANPQAFCVGSNTLNFYTSLAPAKTFLMQAFNEAGATPLGENAVDEPDPSSASPQSVTPGSDEDDEDVEEKPKKKSRSRLTQTQSSGCSAAPTESSGANFAALAVVTVGLIARARRRRSL